MRTLPFLCFLSLFLAGCAGYRLGPSNGQPAGARSIQIAPIVNKTLEPRLGDYVNNSLRRNLQQDGTFRLDTHDDGDIIVSGVITSYRRSELSYVPSDVITVQDYEVFITAQITARERASGRIILDRPVTGHASLRVGNDLPSAERQAIPVIADNLARQVTALLTDGTW